MKEIVGNIWHYHKTDWICITTNGFIKKNGQAVMGRGTAQQCAKRYPQAPRMLGQAMELQGNVVLPFLGMKARILSFPVKHNWFDEQADIGLIEQSAFYLVEFVGDHDIQQVYLPRPGCGCGQLQWADVKPVLTPILDDKFTVVNL